MKKPFTIFLVIISISICKLSAQTIKLDEIRKEYSKAVDNQLICEKWYHLFEKEIVLANQKLKAYKGGITITMARFVVVAKKTPLVLQGKKMIEEAIAASKDDVEIRFIRYSIQVNLPPALGYNKNKIEDRVFINTHLAQLPNEAMRLYIKKFMEDTKSK
ncbi:MAG: hypothetical protein WCP57_03325 [Bacteroidota bacterium]